MSISSFRNLAALIFFVTCLFQQCQISRCAIVTSGDISITYDGLDDPWDVGDALVIGNTNEGSLQIENGSFVTSTYGTLGNDPEAFGHAFVSGPGSEWNSGGFTIGHRGVGSLEANDGGVVSSTGDAYVGNVEGSSGSIVVSEAGSQFNVYRIFLGNYGIGRLDIDDEGEVNVQSTLWVGQRVNGEGAIHFDGGILNAGSLLAGSAELHGTGIINTQGLVTDVSLTFDSMSSLQQQIVLQEMPNQNITINLDLTSPLSNGSLGAGFRASGTLTISSGINVRSSDSDLGYHAGSFGAATVTGSGTTWNTGYYFNVGRHGSGSLSIEDGAKVISSESAVGSQPGTEGTVIVTGPESEWRITFLAVGRYRNALGPTGDGHLHIANGGLIRVGASGFSLGLLIDEGSTIKMETGGRLAFYGDYEDSLSHFFEKMYGYDEIRYWNGSAWDVLTNGTINQDYWLDYETTGSLDGYTVLTVGTLPLLEGDFDGDQDVDGADFLAWQRNPNVGDLSSWKENFGYVLDSPSSNAAQVPEPTSVVLTLLAISFGMVCSRHVLDCRPTALRKLAQSWTR